ncbi:response regulator [Thermoactinomyces mirandus]|uniref:Response regulator n=1 Tax=Thermoactinomyces mirandus TaxID=2756294 RepID=A0A7W2ARA7_9BACL|nr:response regulator [Thermoactinomyces mirandus]MBA4602363.1 response regulator [Thermoactinomyces mirandus]
MRFFIVDDDASIRAILTNIIEDEDLGTVVGEAQNGLEVDAGLLNRKRVDILLIDLLMPERDGIETIKEMRCAFQGKIVMISQVETKELIGEAYSLGTEYYVTKPINRLEVISILTRVKEKILLEKSIHDIQASLKQLSGQDLFRGRDQSNQEQMASKLRNTGRQILLELGIASDGGHKDLLDILDTIYENETNGNVETLSLKKLFEQTVRKRAGNESLTDKEVKSSEQRVRRAIHQSLEHIASLGLTDYSNPTFEHYASTFFDFSQVRAKMLELEGKTNKNIPPARINIKKFIHALYMEASQQD